MKSRFYKLLFYIFFILHVQISVYKKINRKNINTKATLLAIQLCINIAKRILYFYIVNFWILAYFPSS